MRKKYKNNFLILIFLLCIITIGFASLSTTLNINGTTKIKGNTWNVYFDNVQVKDGSVDAAVPSISGKTKVDFNVLLSKPGDFYEFTVDVVNDGTIDAKIGDLNIKRLSVEEMNSIYYAVRYDDGYDEVLGKNDYLNANTTRKISVLLKYKDDIFEEDLLKDGINLDLSVDLDYIQSDDIVNENYSELKNKRFNYYFDDRIIDYEGYCDLRGAASWDRDKVIYTTFIHDTCNDVPVVLDHLETIVNGKLYDSDKLDVDFGYSWTTPIGPKYAFKIYPSKEWENNSNVDFVLVYRLAN